MIRFKAFVVMILACTLFILIYLQSHLSNRQQHLQILSKLQKIDKNSTLLNQRLLKTHQGLLRHYDDVLATINKLKHLNSYLKNQQLGFKHQQSQFELLQKKIIQLETATEQFLADNSIFNNSLAYLAVLNTELPPIEDEANNITILSRQLLGEIFLFTRWFDAERKNKIEKLADQLIASTLIETPENTNLLPAIIAHGQIISEYSKHVSTELNTIFSLDVNETVTAIRHQYLAFYSKKRQQNKFINWGIYGVSFSLLLMLFNFIFNLRSSNNALHTSHKNLLSEIQQRTKAEQQQRAQALFSETILDNISDGIVVCNNQGILVLFNKAAEKIYGQGLKPVGADNWAQQYHLYDKQGQTLLKKEQLPLYRALTKGYVENEEIIVKFDLSRPKTVLINGTQIINKEGEKNGAVICIRDITSRKKTDTEIRLATTAFEAHEAIMITDENANIIRVNKKFTEITGYTKKDVIGRNPRILKSNKHNAEFYFNLWHSVINTGYWQGEIFNKRKNGDIYQEWMSISAVKNEQNHTTHYISHFRDITEHKYQQQQITRNADEERVIAMMLQFSFLPLDMFLQQSIEAIVSLHWLNLKPKSGIFLTDQKNPKQLNLVCNNNLSPELLTLCATVPFGKCLCGRAAETGEIQFSSCMDHRHEITFKGMKPHGHYNVPILDADKVIGVLVLYLAHGHYQKDYEINFLKRVADVLSLGITRKQAEQKVEYLAYHDNLTALPNRMLLKDRLKQVMSTNIRQNHYAALLYIDLDRFKSINDSLGHSIGDALLKEVAERFKHTIRTEDTVARFGGDEFVILLTNMPSNRETAAMEAQHVANKLHIAISKEMKLLNHKLFVTLSIGVVIISEEEDNIESLMMQADTAMYQAKHNGRNSTQFFMPEMQSLAKVRLELEKDLRYAIVQDEIQVFYQPQINASGGLTGAEALMRWKHPHRGFVSPTEFIPIAEESGFILNLGRHVLKDACQKIQQWQEIESLDHIAVNVSPVQFRQPDFVKEVQQIIELYRIDAKKLMLELTEGILVDNIDDVIHKMEDLKQLGIQFSIDDFGTGYSSLAYLTKFPLDQLKIDKSFVDDIGKDKDDQIIIETIIAMADRLSYKLIAEGVENIEQVKFLTEKDCFNYQGYYFSRPLPSNEFTKKYL